MVLAVHPAAQMDYQPPPDLEPMHRPFDQVLDAYVRDGLVYYRALQSERARLDGYVASLGAPSVAAALPSWDRSRQIAFWINAYNAIVLQTVIGPYPAEIRKIPGAFDRMRHAVAGRSLTLDQIENDVLAPFGDPRIYLVLGRGSMGSGRLRSEAFSGARLDAQLDESMRQFATSPRYVRVDPLAGTVGINPIVSWRAQAFIDAYAGKAMSLPGRTPIELAVVGFIQPYLLPSEIGFVERNTFRLAYLDFDWQLNDRTGIRY